MTDPIQLGEACWALRQRARRAYRALDWGRVLPHLRLMTGAVEIRQAATLVVMRDTPRGPPHFLMAERSASMNFAAGAWVFPGGAVDEADLAHARALASPLDMDDLAARIAAIRETVEECGLALTSGEAFAIAGKHRALRKALRQGSSFSSAAAELDLAFDFDSLIPFARWCPPARVLHTRFDTRFYLAVAGEAHEAWEPDGGETTSLAWHSAREVLNLADAGQVKIIFPTRRNLERLAQFGSSGEIIEHARAHPVTTISPWIESRDGVDHLCIPEGLGYPVTSEPVTTASRT